MKTKVKKWVWPSLFLIAGLFLGWLIFHSPHKQAPSEQGMKMEQAKTTVWTCSMHPQIRMDHPGKCPICGMDLIPLQQEEDTLNANAITMTEEAARLADVETSLVTRKEPVKEVRLYGRIVPDERSIQTQAAHIPGRIEQLNINFTGEKITEGQVIATIYSPALVNAQEELLEAWKMSQTQPLLLAAAKEKLSLMMISDDQIEEVLRSGQAISEFKVRANVTGTVISKFVNIGDHVQEGSPLYEVSNLDHVWAVFDAYESDLPWIRTGDHIKFIVQSLPGVSIGGTIAFIDPVVDPVTRVARVRVDLANYSTELKPEMFLTGYVSARLETHGTNLVIPQSSVLWTGTRSIVYVKVPGEEKPTFMMREITLGPSLSNSYVVLDGLSEGEEIVTNGTFSVDAAAQLAGKPSMMNPPGTAAKAQNPHAGMKM